MRHSGPGGAGGVSKAALIRRYVGERLRVRLPLEEDPLWDIVGMVRGGPDDSMRVNEVVYGDLASSCRGIALNS